MVIRSSGTLQTVLTDARASASMIPGEELYQAFATGAAGLGPYEVTNDHIRPSISISSNASVINLEAMERLPADIQRVLVQTLNEHLWRVTAHVEIAKSIALRRPTKRKGRSSGNCRTMSWQRWTRPGRGYGKPKLRKAIRRLGRSVKWGHSSRSSGIFERNVMPRPPSKPSGRNTCRARFATAGGFR